MRHCTLALLMALGLVLAVGCNGETVDDGGPPDTDGQTPTPDTGPAPSGLVTYKNAGESAEADFSGGSEEYLVVPYSVSTTSSTGISFDIKLTSGGGGGADAGAGDGGIGSSHFKLRYTPPTPMRIRNPQLWASWQRRLAVERWSRSLAEKAAQAKLGAPRADLSTPLAGETCSLSSECAATEVCHEGTCAASVTLKVESFSTSATTIDAQVKKKGTVAAILVDSNDTVDQANIDAMLDKFEKLIYPRDVALFGNPPLQSGGNTLSSDRNADGLIWLVFTSKVTEKNNAVGFFVATDFDDTDAKSNKADILYIDSGLSELTKAYTTIAHELQHLLGFAVKVYKAKVNGGQGALEDLWLDEGQSHFAEDACGYGGENVALLDQETFTSFETTSLLGPDDTLAMRGMAFTFVRYLFEQAGGVSYGSDGTITDKGGAAALQKLHESDKQGTDALQGAFGKSFGDGFDGWITAMSLDGRGVTSFGAYVFDDLIDDPVTGNKVGVKIRGTRKDDSGSDVNLQGPLETDLTADTQDSIPNASGKFFKLSGQSGKMQVTVTSQESDFRFALIKLK